MTEVGATRTGNTLSSKSTPTPVSLASRGWVLIPSSATRHRLPPLETLDYIVRRGRTWPRLDRHWYTYELRSRVSPSLFNRYLQPNGMALTCSHDIPANTRPGSLYQTFGTNSFVRPTPIRSRYRASSFIHLLVTLPFGFSAGRVRGFLFGERCIMFFDFTVLFVPHPSQRHSEYAHLHP